MIPGKVQVSMDLNEKLLPFLEISKPIKVAVGGRGSGKSIGFGDMLTMKMQTECADIYCLREFQDSLADSVHRVFKDSVQKRLCLEGWDIQENKVIAPNGARTNYKGASRNTQSIQSAQGYKYSWFEEAQTMSQDTLDTLLPTILRNPGAECWFSGNPQSANDPFSQRFIVPYLDELLQYGYYEDDLHLIVMVNWADNPWWNEEQEILRKWDFDNLTRAKYDWIWEGKFNDSVENSLIMAEWFDACLDAHTKLGFEPRGMIMAAHDPSDEGKDSKGYAARHGSIIFNVQEKKTGNVNEGGDWAVDLALVDDVDHFTWDCDGMGVALGRQISTAFDGKKITPTMFKGSEGVDFPDKKFTRIEGGANIKDNKTNKDALRNKRAQYYMELRRRVWNTYCAVTKGEYIDPETMISFDTESIDAGMIRQLRSELCRMPIKPSSNGLFEMYTKKDMITKFKFKSPNLADSVMMLMRQPHKVVAQKVVMPQSIRPMGRR